MSSVQPKLITYPPSSLDIPMIRRWVLRPHAATCPPKKLEHLAAILQISPFLTGLLQQRGLVTVAEMDRFLSPGLRHLTPPSAWPELQTAAQMIAAHLTRPEAGKTLAVWGDYDVDGITATALVLDFLRQRGITAHYYLPRREEGYGLNLPGIESLAAVGVTLLLTVDCGIADVAAVARASELGITVVISDHHLPGPKLPRAAHLVNPRLPSCPCPELKTLAGVGVAFLLMAAVNRLLPGNPVDLREFLDLVALGTLTDVVELTGQNRILAKNGMLLLAEARRPGIRALKAIAGYTVNSTLDASQVVFGLAPRINAAGRIDNADTALQLLLAQDIASARPLANRLDNLNRERRIKEKHTLAEALLQTQNQNSQLGLVLFDPNWHPGVIGIVASRVVEATNRPVLILCQEDKHRAAESPREVILKGSGRSIPEFDLHAALTTCAGLLLRFGGHRQAAGLKLVKANLESLREAFHATVAAQLGPKPLIPWLKVDAELPFDHIDFTLLKELKLLEPFGMGNPTPLFVSPPVAVKRLHAFGRDKSHALLALRDQTAGITFRGKAWRQAATFPPMLTGTIVRVAFCPQIDHHSGFATIDLHIKDLKLNIDQRSRRQLTRILTNSSSPTSHIL